MEENKNNENAQEQPVNIADVSGSSFIKAIKEIDAITCQPWMDERGWLLIREGKYSLQVWIYEDHVTVSPHGYGSCQPLIAKTSEELKECCEMWWRNR